MTNALATKVNTSTYTTAINDINTSLNSFISDVGTALDTKADISTVTALHNKFNSLNLQVNHEERGLPFTYNLAVTTANAVNNEIQGL